MSQTPKCPESRKIKRTYREKQRKIASLIAYYESKHPHPPPQGHILALLIKDLFSPLSPAENASQEARAKHLFAMVKKRQTDAHDATSSTDSGEDDRHHLHHHHPGGRSAGSAGASIDGSSPSSTTCQHIKRAVDATKLRRQLKATGLVYECSQCQKLGQQKQSPDADAGPKADDIEYDSTLWLCLKCGTQLCGRSRNKHALEHHKVSLAHVALEMRRNQKQACLFHVDPVHCRSHSSPPLPLVTSLLILSSLHSPQTPRSESHALAMNTRSFDIWCYECDMKICSNLRKNLLECVELVKRLAQKPPATPQPPTISNLEMKIKSTVEQITSMAPLAMAPGAAVGTFDESSAGAAGGGSRSSQVAIPMPPPPPNTAQASAAGSSTLTSVPGMAKRIGQPNGAAAGVRAVPGEAPRNDLDRLPRVRGLTNLGNTCFFNAVMQCLAQTPFLLSVMRELAEPGEE